MARILITDDSAFLRRRLRTILDAAGHQVLEAANGVECLDRIATETPDLLLLDLVMPEMGGLEVLAALKGAGNATPVVVLTADIQESVRAECLQLGAFAFINKPPKAEAILAALQEALSPDQSGGAA